MIVRYLILAAFITLGVAAIGCHESASTRGQSVSFWLAGPKCDLIPELSAEKLENLATSCLEKKQIFFDSNNGTASRTLCRNAVEGTLDALENIDGATSVRRNDSRTITFQHDVSSEKRVYVASVEYDAASQQVTAFTLYLMNPHDKPDPYQWYLSRTGGLFRINKTYVPATWSVGIDEMKTTDIERQCRDLAPGSLGWVLANLESRSLMCPKGERPS